MGSQTRAPGSAVSRNDWGDLSPVNGAWTLGDIAKSDNQHASQALPSIGYGHALVASGFGFSIPTDATVLGIEARVERHCNGDNWCYDQKLQLDLGSGPTGTDQAALAYWPTTDAVAVYGGPTDLWGLSLTPADINSASFGVGLQVWGSHETETIAYVDQVTITVYHDGADGGGSSARRLLTVGC